MARRPAAIHWQIARKISQYAASGTDAAAVYRAANDYRGTAFTMQDVNKVSTVLDRISLKQAGYWHGFLTRYFL